MMFEDIAPKKRRRRRVNKQAMLLWGLMFVVAIPGGWLFWQHRNYTAAQANLEEMNAALSVYFEKFNGYPDTLTVLRGLGTEGPLIGQPEQAGLLPAAMALDSFSSGGYRYHYRGTRRVHRWAATVPLYLEYELTATPIVFLTARIHLATDETGEILDGRSAARLAEVLKRRAEEARLAKEAEEAEEGEGELLGAKVTATPAGGGVDRE